MEKNCLNCDEPLFGMDDFLCSDCEEDSPVKRRGWEVEQAMGDVERAMALARRAYFNRPW